MANSASNAITLELLAPARDAETAIAAINHGADAVYMGAPSHGARKQAANSLADIARVVQHAHIFGARVYITVNTIVYDSELQQVEQLVWQLWQIGVDALIVQDLALLQMHLPPIALHASTQCDIRTPQKARFLADAGFTQLVLPRELSLSEIAQFHQATPAILEAFVHGALCVSYSGDCQASYLITGRSANRGECAQICRYRFNLEDTCGNVITRGMHLLSLKDMKRIDMLREMADAGVRSFKIEGRLKDAGYVKNVVAAYSAELNRIVACSGGKYCRSSDGTSQPAFTPDLNRTFNRTYTTYFLEGNQNIKPHQLARHDTPKFIGLPVGEVIAQLTPRKIRARLTSALHNGDGIGYFTNEGIYTGFRLNSANGQILNAASDITAIRPGTKLYRNSDAAFERELSHSEGNRKIDVALTLRIASGCVVLEITDESGISISVADHNFGELTQARTPQQDSRRAALMKLGDTIFNPTTLTDLASDIFLPASKLTALRRRAIEALVAARIAGHKLQLRPTAGRSVTPMLPAGYRITRHDNIANILSARFLQSAMHESADTPLPRAIEVTPQNAIGEPEPRVMQTRYCLRRELGACMKTPGANKLPAELYLTANNFRLRVVCDCVRCQMNLHLVK